MLWFNNQNIAIFFSQKSDGDLLFKTQINSDQTQIDTDTLNEKVRQNRISFFEKNKINPQRLVNLAGIHGTNIVVINHHDLGKGALETNTRIPNTDGLISNIKNSYLMITGADCFPVFFYDENKGIIGAAHCGWRGILKQLPAEMIEKFKNEFSSNTDAINVWIGPGIKTCHYDVLPERADLFSKDYKKHIIIKENKIFLDLIEIITAQLIKTGVKPDKITTHPDCTFCEKDKYFSHHRDKTEIIEANAFIIGLN